MNGIVLGIVVAAAFLLLALLAFFLYLRPTGLVTTDLLFRGLVALVRASLSRSKQRSIELTIDGDVLKITNISAKDQRLLIDKFAKLQEQKEADQQTGEHKSSSGGVEE